uniref:Protein FAR1-RELATED SEQUENCE n=1 Tax=Aegilops tauschii subsp. strangulata TaxID=200361 RepID=A0A452XEN4_AEGTS
MVVKLKDGRWEVVFFIAEHNHALVDKPSLTKYLRSHQGIPPKEKLFLKNLHNCNLTTGVCTFQ